MQEEDLQALRTAVAVLEHPGLAARFAEIAGKPIELVGRALPETVSKAVATATTKALDAALSVALRTMKNEPKAAASLLHKALAATSGAVGGSFGLAALPIELPISTIIMLRSIGDVARSEGEDLTDPETALNCLQVFALGGLKGGADAANSGYFAVRGLLAKSVAEAARFIVDRGVLAEGAPVLVPTYCTDRIPLRHCCHPEAGGSSGTIYWRTWRRGGELRVHRSLSGDGAGALRRTQTRATLRQRHCPRSL